MSKFMKIALVILILGITVTVVRQGMKKSGDSVTTTEPMDQNGKDGASADGNGSVAGGTGSNKQDSNSGSGGANNGGSGTTGAGSTGASADGKAGGVSMYAEGVTNMKPASKPESNCFAFEYKHQKEAESKDIEDFLDYSNAFPVLHDKVAAKSICVKVNGKPTAHKLSKYKNQQEIVIGSVVGPESVIKVSYCVDTAACKEACAVKSNRFMDDLMSDAGDEDEFKESWGDAKEQKKELQAKVKAFRNVASENRDLQKQSTIRSWDTVQQNDWVCKK